MFSRITRVPCEGDYADDDCASNQYCDSARIKGRIVEGISAGNSLFDQVRTCLMKHDTDEDHEKGKSH